MKEVYIVAGGRACSFSANSSHFEGGLNLAQPRFFVLTFVTRYEQSTNAISSSGTGGVWWYMYRYNIIAVG